MKKLTPLSKETFEKLKEFGSVASFAVWAQPDEPTPENPNVKKTNTGDMSVFSNPNLLSELKDGVVFIGLNASVHANRKDGYVGPWANFHSDDNWRQQDFRLRYALNNSPYRGCYITDVIKNHPDKNAKSVMSYIKKNPDTLTRNLETLRRELSYFNQKPLIIALGKDAYDSLKSLYDEYTIIRVNHYSFFQEDEVYKKEIATAIESAE